MGIKNILVTGGTGYIGSHTVVELVEADYNVIIVDNFSNSNPKVVERIQQITGIKPLVYDVDLLDKDELNKVFDRHIIDGVIHFAGLKSVGESTKLPLKYYNHNILSTINLCEIMSTHKVKRLVFSSSATVYSDNNVMPVNEKSALGPSNPYGKTKLMIEEILNDLIFADSEWEISILRYFNPVGAHETGLIGEEPKGIPNNLMPYITNVAIGKFDKLKIFGSDYNTVDGTGVRDYIHVVDLAIGHIKALEALQKGVSVYNMGTGRGHSVLEVISAFEKVNNKNVNYEFTDRRAGDVAVSFADVSKAEFELNWKAKRNIDQMCLDAWNWQVKNPDGYS